MGVLSAMFDQIGTVIRRTTSSPTSTDTITTATTISCLVRPVSEKSKLFFENNMGKEHIVMCPVESDVQDSDAIYIGGVKYSVIGAVDYTDRAGRIEGYRNIRVTKS